MNKPYELYFIVDINLSDKKREATIKRVQTDLVKDLKATDIVVDEQGAKKFAYPINNDMSGYYVLINYQVDYDNIPAMAQFEKKLNLNEGVIRSLNLDLTDHLKKKEQEVINEKPEFENHRDYNKGKKDKKNCYTTYLGKKAIDYRDTEYLEQFMSPYAKIFSRDRTGSKAKIQRQLKTAIKRARHMALLPFTTKHFS